MERANDKIKTFFTIKIYIYVISIAQNYLQSVKSMQ